MKTLSLAFNAVFIIAFIFYACTGTSSVTTASTSSPSACIEQTCRDYTGLPLNGLISGNVLSSMTDAYRRDPGKKYVSLSASSEARSEVSDATSIWFPLEKIKQYIWYIENQVCRSDCPGPQLGIRFYYMKYPANVGTPEAPEELRDVPRSFANLHSLAMVPGFMVGGQLVDFDPRYIGPGCSLRLLRKPKEQQAGVSYVDTAKIVLILKAGTGGEGNNHGGLEPPNGDGIYGN